MLFVDLVDFIQKKKNKIKKRHCSVHSLNIYSSNYYKMYVIHLIFFIFPINSLPWDRFTLIGYFYALIFDLIVSYSYLFVSSLLTIIFISVCLFHPAFYETFEHSIRKLGRNRGLNESKLICDMIRFHSLAKR